MKRCCTCKTIKSETEFYTDNREKDGLQRRCKLCMSDYQRNHSEIYNQAKWKYKGLCRPDGSLFTASDYDDFLITCNHNCVLCGANDKINRLCIDHDAKTGIVRNLLCHSCNRSAVGGVERYGFYRTPEITAEIKAYLADPRGYKRPGVIKNTGLQSELAYSC